MVSSASTTLMNDLASFEASLREAPQDGYERVLQFRRSSPEHTNPAILRCSGEARASKDVVTSIQDSLPESFAMPPPNDGPHFDLPLSSTRW